MGAAVVGKLPLGFAPVVDEHRAAAGAASGFDIVENIAHHPRSREINTLLPRGFKQHARPGLAAFTDAAIRGDLSLGMVGAIVKAAQ